MITDKKTKRKPVKKEWNKKGIDPAPGGYILPLFQMDWKSRN